MISLPYNSNRTEVQNGTDTCRRRRRRKSIQPEPFPFLRKSRLVQFLTGKGVSPLYVRTNPYFVAIAHVTSNTFLPLFLSSFLSFPGRNVIL